MSNEVERRPLLRGIVQGTLLHDNNEYAHGSEFTTTDQALFDQLRKLGAVKLPYEVAEAAQSIMENKDAEIEALRKQIAEMEAQAQAQSKPAKAAKPAASDAAE